MLGILKKFWNRTEESNVVTVPAPSRPAAQPPRAPNPFTPPARRAGTPPSAPMPAQPVSVSAKSTTLPVPSVPGAVTITLGSIEPSLPEPLRHKIAGALHELVPVPVNKVLPQLHRGSVSLTVKELRECAPELLASFQGHDDIPVTLPLADIVRQIDPKVLPRRPAQKKIEVPKDVSEIFTHTSDGLTIIAPATAAAEAPRPTAPAVRATHTATATVAAHAAAPAPAPTAAAAPVTAAKPEKISLSPQALAALAATAPAKSAAKAAATNGSAAAPTAAIPAPNLPRTAAAAAPAKPTATAPVAAPVSLPKPVVPVVPVGTSQGKTSATLAMLLEKLVPSLPPEICKELGDVDVKASSIGLPMAQVESMLKSGKVLFTWGELTSWLTPPLPRPPSNSASSLLIELPLKVVAPVFMAHHRANSTQKRADTGEGIPDLFQSGNGEAAAGNAVQTPVAPAMPAPTAATPKPTAPAPATANPVVAPAKKTAKAKSSASTASEQPALPPIESLLGTSAGRFSPKEVAQNVCKIPGITGALIAMPDGLPVASIMPDGLKGDTLAAFLPQMFGRMAQYTKELGLGGLQSMTLNVEGGSWLVFKQPNIYFAVSGKAGEPIPFNLMAQVAADLSKQTI
jgi:predicted regulator of Ras-like GTPase activity (Roadblock/LC7/MglB family)